MSEIVQDLQNQIKVLELAREATDTKWRDGVNLKLDHLSDGLQDVKLKMGEVVKIEKLEGRLSSLETFKTKLIAYGVGIMAVVEIVFRVIEHLPKK